MICSHTTAMNNEKIKKMNMKTIRVFTVIALLLALSTQGFAQSGRSAVQRKRIAHGVQNGELTRVETRQLAKEQRHIRHKKRIARRDGVVTPGERREIRQEKRQASRHIARKKHNMRKRY
mgnify:CR=1 FL=1